MIYKLLILPKIFCFSLILFLSLFVSASPNAHSKKAELTDEDIKLLKSLRITPPSIWIEAHNFKGELNDGSTINLKDYHHRFVLLNFWATWCVPCLKEMPDLEKVYKKMGSKKLVVLAVGMGEDKSSIRNFAEKHDFTFPMIADSTLEIARLYGVENIPITYLINPEGIIIGRAIGVREWANTELIEFMDSKLESLSE
tara:strand:+ start:1409 stop:2002 length:594 start_codon:yes stop_codon:yes gene_type:complete